MRLTLLAHILAGSLGLLCGYVALYSTKGAPTHRRSGMLFVTAMLVMALGGVALAVGRDIAPAVNIPAALITAYLVITALTTVRPLPVVSRGARWLEVGAMLVALGVGTTMLTFGVEAIVNGGKRNGMPAFPFLMFGTIALLGTVSDVRVLRSGVRKGPSRLARHLWRMCTALFIAALSFSVQLAKILARHVHVPGILFAIPMLAVLGTMAYWLWRVRVVVPRERAQSQRASGSTRLAPEPAIGVRD